MQKNLFSLYFPEESIKKFFLRMRFLTFIMIITIASVSAKSYSQTFDFKFHKVPINQVFMKIEQNSDYIMIYNENLFDINYKVSLKADNDSIEIVMDKVLAGTNYGYKISGRQILILKKESDPSVIDITTYVTELQQVVVKGTVTDQQGGPLPGVTVSVKGTAIGTLTDISGKYSFNNLSPNATLIFSFVGMSTQEIPLNGRITVDIVLKEEAVGLNEVVVVAYGPQTQVSVTAAISNASGEEIVKLRSPSLGTTLSVKLPGVTTTVLLWI